MKIKTRILVLVTLAVVSYGWCNERKSNPDKGVGPTFTNPVWDGADPWMVKDQDEYIYCRSAQNSIVVSRSKKMTQRGESKTIWHAPSPGWKRDVRMQPFTWNADGTPNFGQPVPAGQRMNLPSGEVE